MYHKLLNHKTNPYYKFTLNPHFISHMTPIYKFSYFERLYSQNIFKQFNAIFREPQNRILLGYIDEVTSKDKLHVSQKDRDLIAHFFTGGFTEIIIDWLNNGQKETPEEMRDMFRRTQRDVIVHCLKMANQSHKN